MKRPGAGAGERGGGALPPAGPHVLAAARLKALAHPERLRLFQLIRSGRHCCYATGAGKRAVALGSAVGDLAGEFDLAPSTVSHHLKELRAAGLVDVARSGQFLFCRVREEVLAELMTYLEAPLPRLPAWEKSGRSSVQGPIRRRRR